MTSRQQSFTELSAALTGVAPVLLHGTGMTPAYLREVESVVPSALLERLLDTFSGAPKNSTEGGLGAILDDPDLGPAARAITVLWYCGAWTELPYDWRARNGAVSRDTAGIVSSAASPARLHPTLVGTYPAAAQEQGFGAWSAGPTDLIS